MTTIDAARFSRLVSEEGAFLDDPAILVELPDSSNDYAEPKISSIYVNRGQNPVSIVDPTGLQTQPLFYRGGGNHYSPSYTDDEINAFVLDGVPLLKHSGKGTWGTGDSAFSYEWTMTELSSQDKKVRDSMGTGDAPGVMIVINVTNQPKCPYSNLSWVQYTEARQNGKVYTPAATLSDPHPNPWSGNDRYPNQTSRKDDSPYFFLPDEQKKVNGGKAFDGRLTGYKTGDAVFVDWAAGGGAANWGQYSVVSLVGQKDGKNYVIGSLQWEYTTDGDRKLGSYGAHSAGPEDMALWSKSMTGANPKYKVER